MKHQEDERKKVDPNEELGFPGNIWKAIKDYSFTKDWENFLNLRIMEEGKNKLDTIKVLGWAALIIGIIGVPVTIAVVATPVAWGIGVTALTFTVFAASRILSQAHPSKAGNPKDLENASAGNNLRRTTFFA